MDSSLKNVSIIVAISQNGVIGKGSGIPWDLAADRKFFAITTRNATVLVGRLTQDSIISAIGRPLPNRKTIVLTRQVDYAAPECTVVHTWNEALALIEKEEKVFVIGGVELYRQALSVAHTLYLTRVHAEVDGDVFFPDFSVEDWHQESAEEHVADAKNGYPYTFYRYIRKETS
jgi:dihydrofolate reductase